MNSTGNILAKIQSEIVYPQDPFFFQLSLTVGLCIPVKIVAIHIMGMVRE